MVAVRFAAALAVLLVLIAVIRVFSVSHTSDTYTPGPEAALGLVLGERVAANHPGGGTVLVVRERPVGPKAEKMAEKFPEGSRQTCFVNPSDPAFAVLKLDSKGPGYSLWFPLLIVVGGLGIIVGAVRGLLRKVVRGSNQPKYFSSNLIWTGLD